MTEHRFPAGTVEEDLPPPVRRFYRDFFVDVVDVVRREADLGYLDGLSQQERRLALDLLLLNLRPPRSAILIGLAQLAAEEAVPALLELLAETDRLARRIEIARCLTSITKEPRHLRAPLVEAMTGRGEPVVREAHFSDIRLLPPGEQLDLLFILLEDPDSRLVRRRALRELNELETRKQLVTAELPHDAAYFLERRNDPAVRQRLAEAAAEPRRSWEPVF